MTGPLTGLTVIECTTWGFGPFCGVMLGDLGADVIKVENPTSPDIARSLMFVAGFDMQMPDGQSALFDMVNRNKRSIAINLKQEAGRALLRELVRGADIFLENFRPGVFDRLGIGYEDLSQINPRLIYGAASGYGFKGEEAGRPALDLVGQARSGLMWCSGQPGDPPNWFTPAFADVMGACMLAYGIGAAVAARERHGVGQKVEVSHLMACMWLQYWSITSCLYRDMPDWPRFDRTKAGNPLWNIYPCGDGEWLILGIMDTARDWKPFCEMMGLSPLIDDPRFSSLELRKQNAAELVAILDRHFAQAPRAEWERRLGSHPDLIFDRVQRIGDLAADPAVIANEYIIPVPHPRYGTVWQLSHPATLSKTPASVRRTAPALGEHTAEILKQRLSYDDDKIAGLIMEGVIA